MKIKAGDRIKPLHLVAFILVVVFISASIIIFSEDVDRTQEEQFRIDCIDYVRRGCCQNPNLERCEEGELNWDHDEDPYDICCEGR